MEAGPLLFQAVANLTARCRFGFVCLLGVFCLFVCVFGVLFCFLFFCYTAVNTVVISMLLGMRENPAAHALYNF